MGEIRVESWEQLQSALYEDSLNEEIGRYRSPFVFRGQSRVNYDLKTSLIRLVEDDGGGSQPDSEYKKIESNLLRNFNKYAHREAPTQSVWHLLSVAQHHKLPTRLMDWTFSPLVAAHFATEDIREFDSDGVIWRVNRDKVHNQLPDTLSHVLEEENSDIFTVNMLDGAIPSIHEEKERVNEQMRNIHDPPPEARYGKGPDSYDMPKVDMDSISYPSIYDPIEDFDDLGEFVVFFEPPSLDERIVNQSALFSVMPSPSARLDIWLRENSTAWEKIVIPAELKPQIRDFLDQANITERVLFPGLDGLADWLKRYYTPKHKWESLTMNQR